MTRSWRLVLAASLFCSLCGAAHAALPDKPGTTQRVLKAYRKSYKGLPQRYVDMRTRINKAAHATETAAYGGSRFTEDALVEKIASSQSRESLIAAYRAELETLAMANAEKALVQPGKVARFFGAKTRVAILDQQEIERKVEHYTRSVEEVEAKIQQIDEAIAMMPRYLTRGIQLGTPYGRENLKTTEARMAFLAKVSTVGKAFEGTDHKGLGRMEETLQLRITQQIKRDHAAQQRRYETASPLELHAEAMQLMQDIRNAVNEELPRSEMLRSSGNSNSSTNSSSIGRSQLNLGRDRSGNTVTIKSPFSRATVSHSSTETSWSGLTEQLTDGSDYVMRLSSAKVPLHVDGYGPSTIGDTKTLLPVEARMVLEKIVRVSEIHLALAKRDPGLASSIAPWVNGSRFIVLEPEQSLDHYGTGRLPKVKSVEWTRGGVLLGSRIKADLSVLGGESFLDKGRAEMFKDEIETRLTADLK